METTTSEKEMKRIQKEKEMKRKEEERKIKEQERELKKQKMADEKRLAEEAKIERLKTTPYVYDSKSIWGFEVLAKTITPISGSKSDDIMSLVGRPSSGVKELLAKVVSREASMILGKTNPLQEELDFIKAEIEDKMDENSKYAAPLNVLHRDNQTMGSDGKPIVIIPQHQIFGAFRDTATDAFSGELRIYSMNGTAIKGWSSCKWLKGYVTVNPKHIRIYHDPEMTRPVLSSDIVIEGQQPTTGSKGFSRFEVTPSEVYFKFSFTFNPKGEFQNLANKELVIDCFQQSVIRGIGGRRGVNYGMWEVLDIKFSKNTKTRFFDIMKEDLEKEVITCMA